MRRDLVPFLGCLVVGAALGVVCALLEASLVSVATAIYVILGLLGCLSIIAAALIGSNHDE